MAVRHPYSLHHRSRHLRRGRGQHDRQPHFGSMSLELQSLTSAPVELGENESLSPLLEWQKLGQVCRLKFVDLYNPLALEALPQPLHGFLPRLLLET